MIAELILKGLLIGVIFGVPVGAIGALTIQRTLSGGFSYGFITGLGASTADVIYAIVGIFGITVITDFLQKYELACGIVGSILITIYGILIILRKHKENKEIEMSKKNYFSGFATAFGVAILNPATVVSFLVAFSSFGMMKCYSILEGIGIILGIFMGTAIWWGLLSGITKYFKEKITNQIYQRLNLILGGLLVTLGIGMTISYIM